MRKGCVVVKAVLNLLLIALAGCHSGPLSGISAAPQSGLPDPGAIHLSPGARAGSAAVLLLAGSDFETELAQNVTAVGASANFTPAWSDSTSGFDTLAFAIYRFNFKGYSGDQTLRLSWDQPPADFANLWLGFSRWEDNCWDWYPGPASGLLHPGSADLAPYTHPGSGDLLVAVVLGGTAPSELRELRFNENSGGGAWPMFGHDLRHTRCSPYVGAQTGAIKWSFTTHYEVRSSAAIGEDGTIYFESEDDKLYALYPDGSLKWEFDTRAGGYSSPAIGPDGTIYVGSRDYKLYAVNPDGTEKWSYQDPGLNYFESSPAIADDGTIYAGTTGGDFYAFNPNGTVQWTYGTGLSVTSSPAIANDGTIYVGGIDHKLYALNPDGSLRWSYETGEAIAASPSIAEDGTVYIASQDGYLHALTPGGSLDWQYFVSEWTISSAAIDETGTVYIGGHDGQLFALHLDGSLKWSYTVGNCDSSPAIGADGTVYVGGGSFCMYAINADGSLKWSCPIGYGYGFSSPAIGPDGTVYIASTDWNLYAFGD
jgi:outer membrane protein assembly factor BamB